MGLTEQAQTDFKKFTSDAISGFAKPVIFTAPDGTTVTVNAIHTKHHLGVDEQGEAANDKKSSLTVNESLLTSQKYPVRNTSGEVYLKDHQVQVKDSTGTLCKYIIREWYPDEALGLLTCILFDIESGT